MHGDRRQWYGTPPSSRRRRLGAGPTSRDVVPALSLRLLRRAAVCLVLQEGRSVFVLGTRVHRSLPGFSRR